MNKYIIITLALIGMTGLYLATKEPPLGAPTFIEVSPIVETFMGYEYTAQFEKNGKIINVEMTEKEYETQKIKDCIQPIKKDYRFVSAHRKPIISTSTPVLNDYEYYIFGLDEASSTLIKMKTPDGEKIILLESL